MLAFFENTARCLKICSPEEKCAAVTDLWLAVETNDFEFDPNTPCLLYTSDAADDLVSV